MSLMRNAAAFGLAALTMLWTSFPSASAAPGHAPDMPVWSLTVKPEKYEKFIDFPNTQIGDVIRVSVYHKALDGSNHDPEPWKSFYYNRDGKFLGSRQLKQITLPSDTSGSLRILRGTDNTPALANAAANTAMRLFLGLMLSKNYTQFFAVDNDLFHPFVDGMRHNGWKSFTIPRSRDIQPKPKAIIIVKTADNGRFEYMMYQ